VEPERGERMKTEDRYNRALNTWKHVREAMRHLEDYDKPYMAYAYLDRASEELRPLVDDLRLALDTMKENLKGIEEAKLASTKRTAEAKMRAAEKNARDIVEKAIKEEHKCRCG
jgi:hypothetical protein